MLAESLPLLPPNGWPNVAQPQVLVAGCGTGSTAVRAASRYAGATVLALDSSIAALSYARRQAEAIGTGEIIFGQASLDGLVDPHTPTLPSGPFDVIECSNWLQVSADPFAGLMALVRQASPQGFLRLGFYREAAQATLRAARDRLAQDGSSLKGDEALRQARMDLLGLADEDPAKLVVRGLDFYDLAGLADLMAQVDAAAFTLTQVHEMLQAAGLEFLGFELPDRRIYAAFKQRHPEPAAAQDLSLWAAFEDEQPHIFLQVYQLWARPTADQ